MLSDNHKYLEALDRNEIKTHKDALKYFTVRYSSFIQNYPKDSLLPACTLSQNGFYFENTTRTIRCFECEFQYNDLTNEILNDILTAHVNFRSDCQQAIASLRNALEDKNGNENEYVFNNPLDINSIIKKPKINLNKQLLSEENRLKTFENTRLAIDVNRLVSNGFYQVEKDNLQSALRKANTSNSNKNLIYDENEPTIIETVSASVPALVHIKCAFCSYECLIFRKSHRNTMFKSPFDEHKEKSSTCPIFASANENRMDFTSSSNQPQSSLLNTFPNNINSKLNLNWLQALFDFDPSIYQLFKVKQLSGLLVDPTLNPNDITVKKIPKIIDHLVMCKLNSKVKNLNLSSTSTNRRNAVLYVPSGQTNSSNTTSDFNQLQTVLNQSENVMSEKAYHPAYAQYEARLESYRDWPATLAQQPTDLAKAGFYYFGIKDMVKCFFCNGGLKNWDHNDDPYQDHVRWFPKCQFIRQLMGYEYVEQIKEKFKNKESGFTNDLSNNGHSIPTSSSLLLSGLPADSPLVHKYRQNKTKRSVSPRTLNSRLDMFIIRKIQDFNIISRESLKQSIEIKLSVQESNQISSNISNYGDDFKSPVDMCIFSYDIDRAKKNKLDIFSTISDFIICNLHYNIKSFNIGNYLNMRYNIYPEHIRFIREYGLAENRSFCLITLKKEDKDRVDEIVNDLEKDYSKSLISLSNNPNLIIIKTNWTEIEEKIKPLIDKSFDISESIQQLQLQHDQQQSIEMEEVISDENLEKKFNLSNDPSNYKQEELLDEKASKLMEENERLKTERLCVICISKEKNVLFLPCAHLTACLDCSFSLQNCPMCRSLIQATVRTFT